MNSSTKTATRSAHPRFLGLWALTVCCLSIDAAAQIPDYSHDTNLLASKYIEAPEPPSGGRIRRFGQVMSYDDGRLIVADQDSGLAWIYRQTGPSDYILEAELAAPESSANDTLVDIRLDRVAIARGKGLYIYERNDSGEWARIYEAPLDRSADRNRPMFFNYNELYYEYERFVENPEGEWIRRGDNLLPVSDHVWIRGDKALLNDGRFRQRPPGEEINRDWDWVEEGPNRIEVEGNDLSGFAYAEGVMTWSTEDTPPTLFIGDTIIDTRSRTITPRTIRVNAPHRLWGARAVTAASENLIAAGYVFNSSPDLSGRTGNLAIFERTVSNQGRHDWRQLPIAYAENFDEDHAEFGAALQFAGNTILASAPGLNRVYILDLDDPSILNHPPEINEGNQDRTLSPGRPHELSLSLSDPDGDEIRWRIPDLHPDSGELEVLEETNQSLRLRFTPVARTSDWQERFTIQALDPSGASSSIGVIWRISRPMPPMISPSRVRIQIDEDAPETALTLPNLPVTDPHDDPLTWELIGPSRIGQSTLTIEDGIPVVRFRPHPNASGIERLSLVARNQNTIAAPTTGVLGRWHPDEDDPAGPGGRGARIELLRMKSEFKHSPIEHPDRILFRVYSHSGDRVYQRPLENITDDQTAIEAILNTLGLEPWPSQASIHETVIQDLLSLAAPGGLITFEASLEIEIELVPHNDTPTLPSPIELIGPAIAGNSLSQSTGEWEDLETSAKNLEYSYQWMVSDSPNGANATPIPGADRPVLYLSENTSGRFVALEISATDQLEPGHQGEVKTGKAISQFTEVSANAAPINLSESIPVEQLSLARNLGGRQGRVTRDTFGFFLGGPWFGLGRTVLNFNDHNAAAEINQFLPTGPSAAYTIKPTEILGTIYLQSTREREKRFYEFPDILSEDRAILVGPNYAFGPSQASFPVFADADGNLSWLFKGRSMHGTRDILGRSDIDPRWSPNFQNIGSPEDVRLSPWWVRLNPTRNQLIALFQRRESGSVYELIPYPIDPSTKLEPITSEANFNDSAFFNENPAGWGFSPDSKFLLLPTMESFFENGSRIDTYKISIVEAATGSIAWQMELDRPRDRIFYRVGDHELLQNPIAFDIEGKPSFAIVRTTNDPSIAALEFRSWERGEVMKTMVAKNGSFQEGDWFSPENKNLFIYPSEVDPSLVVIDLATGESISRYQPFRKQRDRLPTTEIALVDVADDGVLFSFWEGNGSEYHKMIAYHPDAPGDVEGLVWDDANQNGKLDLALIQSDNPHIIYTLDVSGSTADPFQGTAVGDPNGDGSANTILDAEIAAFIRFHENLLAFGLGDSAMVSVMVFGNNAGTYTPDGLATDGPKIFAANADEDGDQVPDVIASLRKIRQGTGNIGGGTEFNPPLTLARRVFAEAGTQIGQGNIIFLSDGEAGRDFTDTVETLRNLDVNLKAIGVGLDSSMSVLREIDPEAPQVSSTDDLISIFEPTESLLGGIEVFADLNGNGSLDLDEPTTTSTADNPFSPENEAGYYHLPNLTAERLSIQLNSTNWTPTVPTELELIPVIRNQHLLAVRSTDTLTPEPSPEPEPTPEPTPEPEPEPVPLPPTTPPVPTVPPTISLHPGSLAVPFGQAASLFVLAAGPEPLSYQWQKDGTEIPGANESILILPSLSGTDQGQYTVVVSNNGGSITSTAAALTVTGIPEPANVEIDPESIKIVTIGSKRFFTFSANGNLGESYQAYQKDNLPGASWTSVGGAETADQNGVTFVIEIPRDGHAFFKIDPTP